MAKHSKTPASNAPQAPAASTTATAAPTNATLAVVYKAGKPYNVRAGTAQANDRTWQALQAVLQAGNGQATRADLQAAAAPFNHVPFVGYCIRRGWLAPVASTAPASNAA